MSRLFILLLMVFCHIIDDYCLQGWLASAKQKSWWEKNAPDKKYRYDYHAALTMHSFSWSFMIMLPIAFSMCWNTGTAFSVALLINMVVHGFVDDLKANKLKINLIIDQSIHVAQIIITWVLFIMLQ